VWFPTSERRGTTVDEKDPRDDTRLDLHDESGITRRDLMRRGAVVGGTLLWVAPAIQSIGAKAYAQDGGSPLCEACVSVTFNPPGPPPPVTSHFLFDPTMPCCDCISAAAGDALATLLCLRDGHCTGIDPGPGPCP
jgi:hypothetical protein